MSISKRKTIVALLGAIGLGASGLWTYAAHLDDQHESLIAGDVKIVKAARNIAFGRPLTKDLITTEKVPRKFLPANPLLESELNIYLGTPLSASVEEGEFLLTTDFGVGDAGRDAIAQLNSPLVIKTADVTLEAERPADAGQAALAAVSKSGGYIVASDIHVKQDLQSFSMTARVPADKFEAVVFDFNEIGVTVERRIRGAGVASNIQKLERELGNHEFVVEGLRNAKHRRNKVKESTIEIIAGDRGGKVVERETTTYEEDDAHDELLAAQKDVLEAEDKLKELRAETALATIDLKIAQVVDRTQAAAEPGPSRTDLLIEEFTASAEAVALGLFATVRLVAKLLPGLIVGSPFLVAFVVWFRRQRRRELASSLERAAE